MKKMQKEAEKIEKEDNPFAALLGKIKQYYKQGIAEMINCLLISAIFLS